jgi:hypothetical protein
VSPPYIAGRRVSDALLAGCDAGPPEREVMSLRRVFTDVHAPTPGGGWRLAAWHAAPTP